MKRRDGLCGQVHLGKVEMNRQTKIPYRTSQSPCGCSISGISLTLEAHFSESFSTRM